MRAARAALACAVAALALLHAHAAPAVPTLLGNITTGAPGFLGLLPSFNGSGTDLIITSFTGSPFSAGSISSVENVGAFVKDPASAPVTPVLASANWPNNFTVPPPNMFTPVGTGLLVADGFLVPGKDAGSIYFIAYVNGQPQAPVTISQPKASYFYHNVECIDMNLDGHLDILTARATKSLFSAGSGELLWLENPGPSASGNTQAWTEHVIVQGPDVQFATAQLYGNASKTLELVAAQFFTSQLSLYQIQLGSGELLHQAVIDSSIGPAYAAQFVDLNGDGGMELLVTNHAPTQDASGVFVYEIPSNPVANTQWNRTQIGANYPITEGGFNQAAPGFAYAVKLHVDDKQPAILLAGDGSQSAYLLQRDNAQSGFAYSQSTIVDLAGTVGSLAAGDVDGDGWVEVFIPSYDGGVITVWTFRPQAEEQVAQPESAVALE